MLARHLEPAFTMMASVVDNCPDDVWAISEVNAPVWQHLVHSLYYLDLWIRDPCEYFAHPSYVTEEMINFASPSGSAVSRSQLRDYLSEVASRSRMLLSKANDETIKERVQVRGELHALSDIILGQIRHSLYHIGSISAIMVRYTGLPLEWVGYEHAEIR